MDDERKRRTRHHQHRRVGVWERGKHTPHEKVCVMSTPPRVSCQNIILFCRIKSWSLFSSFLDCSVAGFALPIRFSRAVTSKQIKSCRETSWRGSCSPTTIESQLVFSQDESGFVRSLVTVQFILHWWVDGDCNQCATARNSNTTMTAMPDLQ